MSEAKQGGWSLEEMLAHFMREFPEQHSIPRGWAALVLESVGDNISWGNSNSGYSPREIGWALVRVFGAFDPEAFGELARGYVEALAYYADGSLPGDLRK